MHFAKVQLAEDKTELEATLPQLCARDLMALTAGLCSRHEVSPRSLVPTCPGEARLATGFATGD